MIRRVRRRARVGRTSSSSSAKTRPIASLAFRRCGTPRWPATRCWKPAARSGERARRSGLDWLLPKQVLDVKGDWAARRPDVRPGGWAFQYANAHYPDLDDTAVVVMAMDRMRGAADAEYEAAIARAREWIEGMQSRDGGWGAFDADNTYYYLNNIPFADHGALLDPPTEDVTGALRLDAGAARRRPRSRQPGARARGRLSARARSSRTAAGTAAGA